MDPVHGKGSGTKLNNVQLEHTPPQHPARTSCDGRLRRCHDSEVAAPHPGFVTSDCLRCIPMKFSPCNMSAFPGIYFPKNSSKGWARVSQLRSWEKISKHGAAAVPFLSVFGV
ncbi:hypothetical protein NPIL_305461 [Nephila pilipes]|uniref:Uncharacterized protein n=1 Tax=Nephila pilipes TaxID=299642 RepID=A0A8X6NAZ1_NEPPI|nr:hypothetical protein NPIL_305461 [Nephila pilipes]